MGGWDPISTGGQLSLITFSIEEIVAETGVSVDEMTEWHKLGWLSFSPWHGKSYQQFHLHEVYFIASLVRFGLNRPMINRILKGLPKPYQYNPEFMAYNFYKQKWQQLPGRSEEGLREAYYQDFRDKLLSGELDELFDAEDWEALQSLNEIVIAALDGLKNGNNDK